MAFMWMGTPVAASDSRSDVSPEQTRTEPMKVVSRKPKPDGLARVAQGAGGSLSRAIAAPALIVVMVVGMMIGSFGVPQRQAPTVTPTVTGAVAPALSGRLVGGIGWVPNRPTGAEVWWTTMTCPTGVQAPCLDGDVSLSDLPTWAGGAVPPG